MTIEKTGFIRYDRSPLPGREIRKYIPQSVGADPDTARFTYPSSAGQGVEVIQYPLRGGTNHATQLQKVPSLVKSELRQAHRRGELREELAHHVSTLKNFMDPGTLALLRERGSKITGSIVKDEDVLNEVSDILSSCSPTLAEGR